MLADETIKSGRRPIDSLRAYNLSEMEVEVDVVHLKPDDTPCPHGKLVILCNTNSWKALVALLPSMGGSVAGICEMCDNSFFVDASMKIVKL